MCSDEQIYEWCVGHVFLFRDFPTMHSFWVPCFLSHSDLSFVGSFAGCLKNLKNMTLQEPEALPRKRCLESTFLTSDYFMQRLCGGNYGVISGHEPRILLIDHLSFITARYSVQFNSHFLCMCLIGGSQRGSLGAVYT